MGTVNTDAKNVILESGQEIQYDEKAKRVLGNKMIIGGILVHIIDEFKGMKPADVVQYIEGDPLIDMVPVNPGTTNHRETGERVAGLNTEDSENNEGMIRYDVIFYVRLKDGVVKVIVNLEAQKDEPTDYHIINRTVYYVCRLISSQHEREFVNQKYNDIRKVYTIWICMDAGEDCLEHIHLSQDDLLGSHRWKGRLDLLNIFLIGLGSEVAEADNEELRLHRFLGTVFSDKMKAEDKIGLLEKEFEIPMEKELEEDLNDMCNLSQGIVEKAEARGEARGVVIGEARGEARGVVIGEARGEARGVVKGEARGIIQTSIKHGVSKDDILADLQESLNITLQKAQDYFAEFGKKTV